jgi:hypothetical protein
MTHLLLTSFPMKKYQKASDAMNRCPQGPYCLRWSLGIDCIRLENILAGFSADVIVPASCHLSPKRKPEHQ